MATIHRPDSPVARCRVCGVHRQFHTASDVPHSAGRDHAFDAETVADFEPGDLTPLQLVAEIDANDGSYVLENIARPSEADRSTASEMDERARQCRVELKARVLMVLGISFDDLEGALS
jgi:hypothetical protein